MADLVKYTGPWKGLNTDNPENSIGPNEAVECDNFILRGGEIRTAPRLVNFSRGLGQHQEICRGISGFLDQNNAYHTVAISDIATYQLSNTGIWQILNKLPITGGGFSSFAQLLTKLFFTNYSPNLYSWTGMSNTVAIEYPGIGARYVFELDARLVLLSTVEVVNSSYFGVWSSTTAYTTGQIVFYNNIYFVAVSGSTGIVPGTNIVYWITTKLTGPVEYFEQRIRATPSGATNIFLPAGADGLATGAWFDDMLDCPDILTGVITVGPSAYLLRTNGISQLTPNGSNVNGAAPFNINHMWASERGMGSLYPSACAQYGALGIFVSTEDIYSLTPSGFQSIAPSVRYALLHDLANATYTPVGTIVPVLSNGYVYPLYMLTIPQGEDTFVWCYSINEQQWFRRILEKLQVTCPPKYVYTE